MIEILIYNILLTLFYYGCTILFVHSEPIILLKRAIGFREEEYYSFNKYKQFIHRGITCETCSSFWLTWIFSGSFFLAVLVSLFAFLLDKLP